MDCRFLSLTMSIPEGLWGISEKNISKKFLKNSNEKLLFYF